MPERPLVSTITPCFRMRKYLKTFLEELPKQTYFDRLEVVLDHNEPSAEELEWVREFQSRHPGRMKHIIVDKVDPIGTSMNRCIRESSAEYLTIWNVDDLRTADSIEQQATVLASRPATGIVYGNFIVSAKFGATEGRLIDHRRFTESDFTRGMIFGPFLMFRRSLLERAGLFDEQLKQGPDYDLSIRLALHGKAAMAPGVLGYYLNEELGASTRPGSLQPTEAAAIALRYGIYDRLNYRLIAEACRYDIGFIHVGDERIPIGRYVPDYDDFLRRRHRQWFAKGLTRYYARWWLSRLGVAKA